MIIQAKLLESNSQVASLILNALAKQIKPVFVKAASKITPKIKEIIEQALMQEPEYASLTNGDLRLEFGIPNVSSVYSLVKKLSDTVDVTFTDILVKGNGLSGSIKITALESSSMNGLVNDPDALVNDGGYSLPWLQWLLYEGNNPIVKNYEVKLGPNPNSRTGMAVMIESQEDWRVPPIFAGTLNNNWITRAIDSSSASITRIIKQTLEESI